MIVNVTLQIEVDPAEWYAVYGQSEKSAEVRKDVRDYVYNAVYQLPGIEDSGAKVTMKGQAQ